MSIEAMKHALDTAVRLVDDLTKMNKEATRMMEQAQKQEPVAWMGPEDLEAPPACRVLTMTDAWKRHLLNRGGDDAEYAKKYTIPLVYSTTPPPRQWVGLTDKEMDTEAAKEEQAYGFVQGALWAETKLKEKNT